jgi:hypothetical protein
VILLLGEEIIVLVEGQLSLLKGVLKVNVSIFLLEGISTGKV